MVDTSNHARASQKVLRTSQWISLGYKIIYIYMYPVLQLVQAKVLSVNFMDENFMDDQLTTKAAEVTPLNTLHGSYMAIAIIDRYMYGCFLLPIFSLLM